ncbi:MAG: redox-regulated ATPase YchF [Thermoleophilaceae bacterium]
MRIGIVGLPNAGKSSLFNALTRAGAVAANYPFTTVEPNVAVVGVPDERLDRVAATVRARPVVPETIAFHDIAGLVRGASAGEGLGNRFLANIRETDAILHVVRAHGDDQVVHPEGRVDPLADVEAIETELLLADLEQAERRLDRVSRQAKGGDPAVVAEATWLRELVEALRAGRPARAVPPPADAPDALRALGPLTAKPVLYVANVDEGSSADPPEVLTRHAEAAGAGAVAVSARLEAELAELEPEEATLMREELGGGESGLDRVIRSAFELLDLISFFTAGEDKEARAHAVTRGTTAWGAAGKVHSDIQRGFVRAEIVPWHVLVELGGYAGARDRGLLRLEGRDYPMQDGDVVTVRFTP